jgi:hypothetical protein
MNDKKEYQKKYRELNKERLKEIDGERSKKWYYDNKEKAQKRSKEYYQKHKDKIKNKSKENKKKLGDAEKLYQKKYRELNKEKRNLKEIERRKNDILYKLTCYYRASINQAFRKNNYTKNSKAHTILDCSFEEFKQYIESKFEPWMNWNNYGLYNGTLNYGWDIDHIIPLSTAETEEKLVKLLNYSNCQPLCSHTNRDIKKNKTKN